MNGMKKLTVILMLLSLTACASRVQRTVYYEYRPPISQASVHTTVQHYQPIEVTVYADRSYRGGFTTIQLVMVDGGYAEIPMRNRRGNNTRIYAHYHAGILHFDADRNCHGIQGASRFKQDNGWQNGRMYTRVSAGKDYDLTGLSLKVRHVDQGKKSSVAKKFERQPERDRNFRPESANADKNSPARNRPSKNVLVKTSAGKSIIATQEKSAKRVDERGDGKPIETEKQARADDKTPDFRSQSVNMLTQEPNREKRNDPAAKAQKKAAEKADSEKKIDPQNVRMYKNEPHQTVVQKKSDERKDSAAKPNSQEKPGLSHTEKANNRHQQDKREKNPVSESKQVGKDRKGKNDKNDQDDNDGDNSMDDESSDEKGRNRYAT